MIMKVLGVTSLMFWRGWVAAVFAMLLAAGCGGGGGGDAGSPIVGGGGGGPTVPVTPVPADIAILLSSTSIPNNAGQTVVATITAVDTNRATMAGVPITLAVDGGATINASAAATDSTGQIIGTVSIGSNTSPRRITVTATSGTLTRTAAFDVVTVVPAAVPTMTLALSGTTVSSGTPVVVSATVKDAKGLAAGGVVVNFDTGRGTGSFSASSALTDASGVASVSLTPSSSSVSGADLVTASASFGSTTLTASSGFSLVATTATITGIQASAGASLIRPVSAYGQSVLTIGLTGASTVAPVTLSLSSACVTAGKATLSATTIVATSNTATVTFKDTGGCGSVNATDTITATIAGTAVQSQLQLYLSSPLANNIVFVSASPEVIYLKGAGLTTSSKVVFQVNDAANNPLPNQQVSLNLSTFTGGLTIEGGQREVTQVTDGAGQVAVLVNSGTVPTPVRVIANLANGVTTVSSNLSVAVGLPSQLNFSLSQDTKNIEGYDIDGTPNNYNILAADRSGNPVPTGTTINFWAEGGQVAASAQISKVGTLSRTSAAYVSQAPRPADGRVTVMAYAIGEESFIDLNGNNLFDSGEPFQDLGDITKDKLFDFLFDPGLDEFISISGLATGGQGCIDSSASFPTLSLTPPADAWIPVRPLSCNGAWTPRTYVRRAVETVLSTSSAQPLWGSTRSLDNSCVKVTKQTGPAVSSRAVRTAVKSGDIWFGGAKNGSLFFYASDANPVRYNPMAAGTVVTATANSRGLQVKVVGGSPVASTSDPFPGVGIVYEFADDAVSLGNFTLTFTSPVSKLSTSYTLYIDSISIVSGCP